MKKSEIFLRITKIMVLVIAASGVAQRPTWAQDAYPNKPIRVLVGFAAGGPTDNAARMVAEGLGKNFGQQIVVENRPGANSQLATQELMRSKPDGYTLLLASNGTLAVAPARYARLPYDVDKDFALVGSVVGYPHVLVVPMQSKATDTSSLIKLAQSTAQGLNAASVGHVNDLTIEWFQKLTGTKLIRVPYKGDSAVINDLVANRIDMAFLAPNIAMPLVEGKKIIALATTSKGKVGVVGSLPTIQDAGILGFEVEIWNGLLAPAGTSPAIVNRLNAALKIVLQAPEFQAKLASSGQHVIIDRPAEFREKIDREGKQWKAIAKEANLPLLEQ